MLNIKKSNYTLTGTKAETLKELENIGYNVPKVYFFTLEQWNSFPDRIMMKLLMNFKNLN